MQKKKEKRKKQDKKPEWKWWPRCDFFVWGKAQVQGHYQNKGAQNMGVQCES